MIKSESRGQFEKSGVQEKESHSTIMTKGTRTSAVVSAGAFE